MPAKSKAMFRFMEAAAHNPEFADKAGIKPKVAKEFVSENVGDKAYKSLPERFTKLKKKMKAKV